MIQGFQPIRKRSFTSWVVGSSNLDKGICRSLAICGRKRRRTPPAWLICLHAVASMCRRGQLALAVRLLIPLLGPTLRSILAALRRRVPTPVLEGLRAMRSRPPRRIGIPGQHISSLLAKGVEAACLSASACPSLPLSLSACSLLAAMLYGSPTSSTTRFPWARNKIMR